MHMVADPELTVVSLFFDKALVNRVYGSMYGGRSFDSATFDPKLDLSTWKGKTFELAARTLVTSMRGNARNKDAPKGAAVVAETVLSLLLASLEFQGGSEGMRHLPVPRSVQRAIDIMHARMGDSVTIASIADDAGISVRALENGFQGVFGVTPKAYLQSIRLKAVHEKLQDIGNNLPVNSVALKCGFTHLGRFSAEYRSAFGELPSETLRNAKHLNAVA
jgi:AraC-like DNA-binding protein